MKKYCYPFLLIIFVLCITSQSFSQLTYGWSEQNSGTTVDLWTVSAADSNVAWIGGDSLKVLRTTNGGVNWSVISGIQGLTRAIIPIYNIFAIDANNAICAGSTAANTYVYKTTNGGANWTTVFSQSGGFIDNIYMYSATNGFKNGDPVGGRFSLWKTTDGGNNWDSTGLYLPSSTGEYGVINNLFVDGSKFWMGIQGSFKDFYSTNYGSNWILQYPPDNVNCFWSNNTASGLFMMGFYGLYITTNFGINWSLANGVPGTAYLCSLTGIGNEWWLARNELSIFYSSNNGANWVTQYTVADKNFESLSKARSGKYIWAVRDGGKISRYGIISGINTISQSVPSEFKLYQNYPNPFNPSTIIKFQIKDSRFVTLKVYDILGIEIATLINEKLTPGTYEVPFSINQFSDYRIASGVFFYVIKAGNFLETKRMIYIK